MTTTVDLGQTNGSHRGGERSRLGSEKEEAGLPSRVDSYETEGKEKRGI